MRSLSSSWDAVVVIIVEGDEVGRKIFVKLRPETRAPFILSVFAHGPQGSVPKREILSHDILDLVEHLRHIITNSVDLRHTPPCSVTSPLLIVVSIVLLFLLFLLSLLFSDPEATFPFS
jgi:hypothetical protein